MRKYVPRKGTVFPSRDALEEQLEDSGWRFEGHEMGFKNGTIVSYNIGVMDVGSDTWLMIDMKPVKDGVKVTRVRRLKLSDERSPKKRKRKAREPGNDFQVADWKKVFDAESAFV